MADSLSAPEQVFCSHVESIGHYLREAGEQVGQLCWNLSGVALPPWDFEGAPDVLFLLDQYEQAAGMAGRIKIAQCAAITRPLPWEVRKPDGTPVFDLILSSIPAMVEAARTAGFRSEFMPLAFDLRARACGMGVKREKKCIFIGSRGPAHRHREELLAELADIVEVLPPVFGRAFFKALAGATALLQPHAEWSQGCANSMKLYEAAGLRTGVVYDGQMASVQGFGPTFGWGDDDLDPQSIRDRIENALENEDARDRDEGIVLQYHTYEHESRVPRLIEMVRSL